MLFRSYGKAMGQRHLYLTVGGRLVITCMQMYLPQSGTWEQTGLLPDYYATVFTRLSDELSYAGKLDYTVPLRYGSSGTSVRTLSHWLYALGYLNQPTDVFNINVLTAINTFCIDMHLPLSYQANVPTLARLSEYGNQIAQNGALFDEALNLASIADPE